MAGVPRAMEEIKQLDLENTIVIDGCEGACGLQSLMQLGVKPRSSLIIKKYASVNENNIQEAEQEILSFMEQEG